MKTERRVYSFVFPGGTYKAFTMSFDDGIRQDGRLIELMKKYGVRGTFNLNSGFFGRKESFSPAGKTIDTSKFSEEEVKEVYKDFEIATHGKTHSSLMNSGALAVREIIEDRMALEELVPYLVTGHAYAYGCMDASCKELLKASGIKWARTITSTHSFELPSDWYEWNPTCHHNDPALMDMIHDFCAPKWFLKAPQVFYLWGHTYEFDGDNTWDRIEEFLSYVSGFKDQIWFATNGELYRYVEAARQLEFSCDGTKIYNPTALDIWFDATGFLKHNIICIHPGETITL